MVNSERSLAESRVGITLCQDGKFAVPKSLYFSVNFGVIHNLGSRLVSYSKIFIMF